MCDMENTRFAYVDCVMMIGGVVNGPFGFHTVGLSPKFPLPWSESSGGVLSTCVSRGSPRLLVVHVFCIDPVASTERLSVQLSPRSQFDSQHIVG